MDSVNMGNGSLMARIQVDTMKKAMDVQSQQVLSVLQSAAAMQTTAQTAPQQAVARMTGVGRNLDIKG